MHHLVIRLLIALLCSLPAFAVAAPQSIHIEWGYTPPATPAVTGYKLYQESALACQVDDPNATAMDCMVSLTQNTTNFTLTATFSDGTESPHSAPFPFTTVSAEPPPPGTTELKAVITANATSGTTPLTIGFNASTSTGGIATYTWDFGDGSTSATQTATHIYTNTGTYTAKLTIADATGTTSIATVAITASSGGGSESPPAAPPTVVISSSAATGQAPLTVSLDGSGSKATNATIVSHSWSFGDGNSATGASASHVYTTAGTFTATLTATDSNGSFSQASTPVIVTTPPATANKPPQAMITTTSATGGAPLTVSFNGGGSSDSDGTINTYVWNFGDGSSASGANTSHTYISDATFTATLQVTDNQGAKGSASVTISTNTKEVTAGLNIEMGEIAVSSDWVRVPFSSTFNNPIVIAGPPSYTNSEPCVIRLRNVDKTGFDIKLAEWNYQDGSHPQETVSFLAMEKGRHTLPDGSSVEAGSFSGTTSFKNVSFSKAFTKTPVVLTTIATYNGKDTVSGRIKNLSPTSFAYYFREQRKNINTHTKETVNFIAWEPGIGTIGSVQFEVAQTANTVNNRWYSASYQTPFKQPPLLLAHMQTTTGPDTSALRVQQLAANGFQVKVEEEQSLNTDVTHLNEAIGYLALNQIAEKKLITFSWDFDVAQEQTITGFQVLANGETLCTSSNPAARQLSCEITKPAGATTFTIQAIEKAGSFSAPANSMTYTP